MTLQRIFDVIPGANGMEYSTPTAIQKGHMVSILLVCIYSKDR
jgi:hypothetical protein